MTVINGHFDGKRVVLDEPVPPDIHPDTGVRVVFDNGEVRDLFAELGRLAVATDDLPPDYAAQHEHYVKGTPRK